MVTFNPPLPDTAHVGDPGHTDDHNTIVAALGLLNSGKAESSETVALDGRLDAVEASIVALDGRLDAVEASIVALDGRLDALEGTPTPLPVSGQPYGSAMSMDALGNAQVGGDSSGCADNWVDFYFRAEQSSTLAGLKVYWLGYDEVGYGGGNGGIYNISVQSDSGGVPSGTVLASTTFPCNYPNSYFGEITFSSPATLVAGNIYHIVFKNTSANVVLNFASVNLTWSEYPTTPRCPKFPDSDWGMLRKWFSPNGDWGSDASDAVYIPIMDLRYGNGKHQGQGYMEVEYDSEHGAYIGGSNQVRLRFTPSRSIVAEGVQVRLAKDGGSGDVTIALKQGATSLGSVTVASTAIDTSSHGYTDANYTAGSFEGGDFASPVTLTQGQEYTLLLTGGASVDAWTRPIQNGGPDYGLHPGTYFDESSVLEISENAGSSWAELLGVAGCGCLQFYLT